MCRIDPNAAWSAALLEVMHLPIRWVNLIAAAMWTKDNYTARQGATIIVIPKVIGAKPANKWIALAIARTEMQRLRALTEEERLAEPVFIFPKFKDHGFNYMLERLAACPAGCMTVFIYDLKANTMQSIYISSDQPTT
jgi:hypothetical protein